MGACMIRSEVEGPGTVGQGGGRLKGDPCMIRAEGSSCDLSLTNGIMGSSHMGTTLNRETVGQISKIVFLFATTVISFDS